MLCRPTNTVHLNVAVGANLDRITRHHRQPATKESNGLTQWKGPDTEHFFEIVDLTTTPKVHVEKNRRTVGCPRRQGHRSAKGLGDRHSTFVPGGDHGEPQAARSGNTQIVKRREITGQRKGQ